MGNEGFVGTSSLLYHMHPPTTVKSARRKVKRHRVGADDDTSLRHRHFLTARLAPGGSPRSTACRCSSTRHRACCTWSPTRSTPTSTATRRRTKWCTWSRGGRARDVFGELPYQPGDYVVIHRGITHRWRLDRRRGARSCSSWRAAATCASEALPQRRRADHRGRAVSPSATSAARELPTARREGRVPHPRQAVRRDQRTGARPPSVRRRRVGRLLLSRGRSTSTTSSRSWGAFTSRRRCTRPSRATAS
jgi:hypothetical protein